MDRFRRGVPDSKAYAQGFARKYRLAGRDVVVEPFDAGPRDAAAYRAACLAVARADERPHLATVITSEEQESPADRHPAPRRPLTPHVRVAQVQRTPGWGCGAARQPMRMASLNNTITISAVFTRQRG